MQGMVSGGAIGASSLSRALLEGDFLGIKMLYLAVLVVVLIVVATGISAFKRWRRRRKINELLKRQRALEGSTKELLTTRKAAEIKSVGAEVGKPKTIIPDGLVAYSESGDMLVFGSVAATEDDDAVAAAIDGKRSVLEQPPPTWRPSYRIDRIIVMHMTGVVMFSVDRNGKIDRGIDVEPELLILLEGLMEDAKWYRGEMVSTTYKDRTVSFTWGNLIHLAAVVEGEPDERLDRELRWAIGDLSDEYADDIWFWGEEQRDVTVWERLSTRVSEVLVLTRNVNIEAAQTPDGSIQVTSTVTWRHGLVELAIGIVNKGPGEVYEINLLPTLSQEGLLNVLTVQNIEVDGEGRFVIPQIEEGRKAVASFIFRVKEPMSVRMDCEMVYRRGFSDIQKLRLPGRWIEVEGIDISRGEEVEPERVFELATQPAIFQDRCTLYLPSGSDYERLFDVCTDAIEREFSPVVILEDPDTKRIEAWFHGEIKGGGSLVVSMSTSPEHGILDLYTCSTSAGVVPGAMMLLRRYVNQVAKETLSDVMDRELRTLIPREGTLLIEGWGDIEGDQG